MVIDRLMIVAGGEWQVPIIRKAKEMGLYVVNVNLYADSPGFRFSDVGLAVDVLDKQKILEYAREYSIDAVITDQSDIAVPTVAYVAESLELPGIGASVATLFTNKLHMRDFCAQRGFPTPSYMLCHDISDAKSFYRKINSPCVVKPPASQSSRGVTKVESIDDLTPAYNSARSYSHDETVIIEEFISGVEVTVDGIQLNSGEHYCLATSCKTHYKHNEMIANRLLFSKSHETIDYEALHCQHNHLIKMMGLAFGLTHAEYKYFNGKFYLIEVAARGGGTHLSSIIVPLMSGVDSNECLIRMALGDSIPEIDINYSDRIVVLDFFEFSQGVVKKISGVEEANKVPGVVCLGLDVKVGDVIYPIDDDRSRHGYVIAIADSLDELNSVLSEVRRRMRIEYE